MLAEIDYESGNVGSLAEARRLVSVTTEPTRLDMRAELAIVEAKRLVIDGRPWAPAIDEAFREIGRPSWKSIVKVGLFWRSSYYGPWIVPAMLLGALVVLAIRVLI